jgi:hypothetical protein
LKKIFVHMGVIGSFAFSGFASAAIELDGFTTAGFAIHDQNTPGSSARNPYLDGITNNLTFENDSKFGFQMTADVSKDMKIVAQFLASAADGNYDVDAEWAYLDYRTSDSLNLRVGKVKQPVYLISDYIEVGYAYPWIRPPQEVYRVNPINTINGMELSFQIKTDDGIRLSFMPYVGSNTEAIPGSGGAAQFKADNFVGAALQVSAASFTFQASTLQTDLVTSGTFGIGGPDVGSTGKAQLSSVGLSWDVANIVGYTEYVTRNISGGSEGLFPDQEAYYVTLGYRMGKFMPHLTFASSSATPLLTAPFAPMVSTVQDSTTLGMRYEINDGSALKVEYQIVNIDSADPGNGLFQDQLGPIDGTTNIFSVAIEAVF